MITLAEIKRIAYEHGVGVETIEKDYCLGWFLKGLSGHPFLKAGLVFKGGTALKKMFFPDYRFSEDLDFTAREDLSKEDLQEALDAICREVTRQSGIRFETAALEPTREAPGETAWEARIGFTGPRLQDRSPRRFKVDITAYEKIHLKPLLKKVHHPYSDTFSARIYVYALEEIVAEKLRTILQRGYPRDLYDAWYLLASGRSSLPMDIAKVKTTFTEKCEYKKVRFSGPGQFLNKTRRRDMERHWQNSIQRQLRDIPSFQTVVSDLEKRLKELFVK